MEPGRLRLRHARHGLPERPERSRLVRRAAAHQAARRSRTSSARTATGSPACARAGSASRPASRRRPAMLKTTFEFELFGTGVDAGQTTIRLRHAYGELGAVRRGPDLEPVHGHRRLPQLGRVLGPDRHGVLPQRAGALDADPGRLAPDVRARAPGRLRRPGRLSPIASSCRTSRATSRIPTSPASGVTAGDWGYVEVAGIVRYMRVGRHPRRPVRPVAADDIGWGVNLSSNIKFGDHVAAAAGGLRRRHPELHERRAGGRRPAHQPRQPDAADRGRGAADARPRRVHRHQLERARRRARSATRCSTSTTPTARPPNAFRRATTPSPTSCSTRSRT